MPNSSLTPDLGCHEQLEVPDGRRMTGLRLVAGWDARGSHRARAVARDRGSTRPADGAPPLSTTPTPDRPSPNPLPTKRTQTHLTTA
jgi:hypothetical protein